MLRIGITGGLGSGKSEVTEFFKQKGARVFDADVEAKLILLRLEGVQKAVIAAFGDTVLNEVGELDFQRLARHAFANSDRQRQLNEIMHPEVILAADKAMILAEQDGVAMFILDAPLLFEAKLEEYLDLTVVVIADQQVRIKRALERGNLTEEDILRRIQLQMPDKEKLARADLVVTNNGTLEQLQAELEALYSNIIWD
ncbi:MAG: dephospho-CoA kinase [Candidatus Marinimicrobia bacterium]|nr:dephospho-CoA kinase [Candidatus Neomarinimicrobiota bacterium]